MKTRACLTLFNRASLLFLLWAFLLGCSSSIAGNVTQLSAREAVSVIEEYAGNGDFVILDIRTPAEFQQGHIAGARSVDYYSSQFKAQLAALDRNKSYLIYCRSGNRSNRALGLFAELGFSRLYHLKGGILDWQANGLKLVPGQ